MFAVFAATLPAISSRPSTERSMLPTDSRSTVSRIATTTAAPNAMLRAIAQ